jgi:hypothetical protein
MSHDDNVLSCRGVVVLLTFFILAGVSLGVGLGWRLTTDHWKREAIKAKAAEWVIVGEEGETEFRWRKP